MGWPLVGNLFAFTKAFRSNDPDSFINNLVSRYGRTGIYKTHLFGKPSITICIPEICRRVMTDDQPFRVGYPTSFMKLIGSVLLASYSPQEHKRVRRLATAPIVAHNSLAEYIDGIEDLIMNSLEEWSSVNHSIELLKDIKEITFKVMIGIFLGFNNNSVIAKVGHLFPIMSNALISLPVNVPGFAFHKALKARRKLARIIQSIIEGRKKVAPREGKKDLVDAVLVAKDENGLKLEDKDIIDFFILLLFGGHESTAVAMMWSVIYLTEHPQISRLHTIDQFLFMKSHLLCTKENNVVIDEMLRKTTITFTTFREAHVNINGCYVIPKGWRVLSWVRPVHLDPEYHPNPQQFIPSRWEDYNVKVGSFIPFGYGSRLCPGMDLAKLEITIFLHYFLLNYK
ncbi:hypothetical protein L6164_001110 [Bauhinia variegata]|uniref:Uncharacterized protein n=1 Tax=Bauhinia variegata TaxID=167791 RepID=A0ACB9Q8I9_BAUVA|nr:hypothetical protein L6164_001110 [Bauhinia variegata]